MNKKLGMGMAFMTMLGFAPAPQPVQAQVTHDVVIKEKQVLSKAVPKEQLLSNYTSLQMPRIEKEKDWHGDAFFRIEDCLDGQSEGVIYDVDEENQHVISMDDLLKIDEAFKAQAGKLGYQKANLYIINDSNPEQLQGKWFDQGENERYDFDTTAVNVCVTTGALRVLDIEGLKFVMGHELGHEIHHDFEQRVEGLAVVAPTGQELAAQAHDERSADKVAFRLFDDPEKGLHAAEQVMEVLNCQSTGQVSGYSVHGTPQERYQRIYTLYREGKAEMLGESGVQLDQTPTPVWHEAKKSFSSP